MNVSTNLLLILLFGILLLSHSQKTDNINGTYAVHKNHHYSNKTSVTWGQNGLHDFQVMISLSPSAATYDCQNTTSYSCEDPSYMYDWNKLWGMFLCMMDICTRFPVSKYTLILSSHIYALSIIIVLIVFNFYLHVQARQDVDTCMITMRTPIDSSSESK